MKIGFIVVRKSTKLQYTTYIVLVVDIIEKYPAELRLIQALYISI